MLWLVVLFSCRSAPPTRGPAPEILIVTVDTLRADHLGYAGYAAAHTPSFDALAASGRVFSGATTPLPRTTPALASLHTGLAPFHHGSREVGTPMRTRATLARALRRGGWHTAAVSAMGVAGPEQGLDGGFDAFVLEHDARAERITDEGLALAATAPGEPLLLWVHYADPHFPYDPPSSGPLHPDAPACRALQEAARRRPGRRAAIYSDRDGLASAALPDCIALYDAEIASVDQAVGRLIEGWRRRRGLDGWVVFSADHGENQGERRLYYEHGPNVHDASLRVPLVMAGPGIQAGVDGGAASLEDVMPTLISLAGADTDADFDGDDLGPRLRGEVVEVVLKFAESGSALHATLFDYVVSGRARRYCVNGERYSLCRREEGAETLHDHVADPELLHDLSESLPTVRDALRVAAERWPPESARERTVRSAQFKLVARPEIEGGYRYTLHDLSAPDPEAHNVSGEHPEMFLSLRQALAAWGAPAAAPPDRAADELEALRALGYVE